MSDANIQARLKQTCVLLSSPDRIGTGYMVARGFAATANHVVASWRPDSWYDVEVGWGGSRRRVQAQVYGRDPAADAAVLKIAGCDDIEPIPVGSTVHDGAPWDGFGFPQIAQVAGKPIGIGLRGDVRDRNWSNALDTHQLLLVSYEARTNAPMYGCSGGPVVVDGFLVGHIVEQFKDPVDRTRSVLGLIKACPIAAVVELLPAHAQYGAHTAEVEPYAQSRMHTRRQEQPDEPDIPLLFSWCDREAVTNRLKGWLDRKEGSGVGLLCLVGHSDNRQALLLERVAQELGEAKPNTVPTQAVHIRQETGASIEEFRRVALSTLDVDQDRDVQHAKPYKSGTRLVLLCDYCDCSGWSKKQVAERILLASTWLSGLQLGSQRLVLVMTIRFGALSLKDRLLRGSVEDRVRDAFAILADRTHPPVGSLLLEGPLPLSDYTIEHLRKWITLPQVKRGLGHAVAKIDDTVLHRWFGSGTRSHGYLLGKLTEFYKNHAR